MKKNFPVWMGIALSMIAVIFIFTWHVGAKNQRATARPEPAMENSPSILGSTGRDTVAPAGTGASSTFARVIEVFDGDTIEIAGGEHVRYIGVDAPEEWYSKKARSNNQCYAEEAKKENKRLVLGRTVRLEKDVRDRDVYGRLLRYVYLPSAPTENATTGSASTSTVNHVPNGSPQEHLVAEMLVGGGFAKATPYPPDIKYKAAFSEEEKFAKENKKGLWGACY